MFLTAVRHEVSSLDKTVVVQERTKTVTSNDIIALKAVSHVINSCALTGEKPCINKAIQALLMHGYATFNMLVPGPQICCHYEMCTARP